jgi:hypothetical protein
MGFTMAPDVLAKWEAPLPTYLNQSTWSKFLVVAKEFPMHWVVHNMYCLPLVLASIVPVLVAGLVSRTLIAQLPHFSGTWSEFEKSKDVGSEKLLTVTLRALQGQIGIYSTLTTLCFVLWAHKIVKPIALRVILPGFLTACTVTTLDQVYAENNGKGLPGYLLIQLVVHGAPLFPLRTPREPPTQLCGSTCRRHYHVHSFLPTRPTINGPGLPTIQDDGVCHPTLLHHRRATAGSNLGPIDDCHKHAHSVHLP